MTLIGYRGTGKQKVYRDQRGFVSKWLLRRWKKWFFDKLFLGASFSGPKEAAEQIPHRFGSPRLAIGIRDGRSKGWEVRFSRRFALMTLIRNREPGKSGHQDHKKVYRGSYADQCG